MNTGSRERYQLPGAALLKLCTSCAQVFEAEDARFRVCIKCRPKLRQRPARRKAFGGNRFADRRAGD